VLVNPGLWDMVFGGGGSSGNPDTLYLTAGGSNQPNFPAGGSTTAVFSSLVPAAAVTSQNFSLNLSAQSVTIAPGGSANLMINAAAVGGFNSPVSLSCAASSGLTCAFNPSTITPGSSSGATLTISVAATPPPVTGYGSVFITPGLMGLLSGLGLFGTVLVVRKRKTPSPKRILSTRVLALPLFMALVAFFAVGCGSTSSSNTQTPASQQVTVTVTGTSGAITQSAPVTVTIN
jgi:hypothetical protein